MLAGPIPALLDHRKLANQQGIVSGAFPVQQLDRFCEVLADPDGDVSLDLVFSKGERDRTCVTGRLQASVSLICQTCLQPMKQALSCELTVVIVAREEDLESLEGDQDGILHPEKLIPVAALIEDELMLAVPMIPRHDKDDCPDSEYKLSPSPVKAENDSLQAEETYKPFADLAAVLKKQKDTES